MASNMNLGISVSIDIRQAQQQIRAIVNQLNQLSHSGSGLNAQTRAQVQNAIQSFNQLNGVLGNLSQGLQSAGHSSSQLGTNISHLANRSVVESIRDLSNVMGDLGKSLVGISSSILETSKDMEQLKVRALTASGGVKSVADEMISWSKAFASGTPFQLTEILDAMIRLKNYGIDATKVMKLLGDAAAGYGKSLTQAVEAYADAQQGEFERLKEFGINKAMIVEEAMKRYQVSIVNSKNQITDMATTLKTIGDILRERTAGGMERMSNTFIGATSNMEDALTELKDELGKELLPAMTSVVKKTTEMIRAFEQFDKMTGGTSSKLILLAGAIGGILTVGASLTNTLVTIAGGLNAIGAAAGSIPVLGSIFGSATASVSSFAASLAVLPAIIGGSAVAMGELAIATQNYKNSIETAEIDSFNQAEQEKKALLESMPAAYQKIYNAQALYNKVLKDIRSGELKGIDAYKALKNAMKILAVEKVKLVNSISKEKQALKDLNNELNYYKHYMDVNKLNAEEKASFEETVESIEEDIKVTEKLIDNKEKLIQQYSDEIEVLKPYKSGLEDVAKAYQEQIDNADKNKKQMAELNKAFSDMKDTFGGAADAILNGTKHLENMGITKTRKRIDELRKAWEDGKISIDEYRKELEKLKSDYSVTGNSIHAIDKELSKLDKTTEHLVKQNKNLGKSYEDVKREIQDTYSFIEKYRPDIAAKYNKNQSVSTSSYSNDNIKQANDEYTRYLSKKSEGELIKEREKLSSLLGGIDLQKQSTYAANLRLNIFKINQEIMKLRDSKIIGNKEVSLLERAFNVSMKMKNIEEGSSKYRQEKIKFLEQETKILENQLELLKQKAAVGLQKLQAGEKLTDEEAANVESFLNTQEKMAESKNEMNLLKDSLESSSRDIKDSNEKLTEQLDKNRTSTESLQGSLERTADKMEQVGNVLAGTSGETESGLGKVGMSMGSALSNLPGSSDPLSHEDFKNQTMQTGNFGRDVEGGSFGIPKSYSTSLTEAESQRLEVKDMVRSMIEGAYDVDLRGYMTQKDVNIYIDQLSAQTNGDVNAAAQTFASQIVQQYQLSEGQ